MERNVGNGKGGLADVKAVLPLDDEESWRLLQQASRVPGQRAGGGDKYAPPRRPMDTGVMGASASSTLSGTVAAAYRTEAGARTGVQPWENRVAELEERVAAGLQALHRESREGVEIVRRNLAAERDTSIERSRRSCAEAELTYRRLPAKGRSPAAARGDNTIAEVESRIASLATSVLAAEQSGRGKLASSQLPERVALLSRACQRQMDMAPGDAATSRAVSAAIGLGDLLVEVDRDCEAMVMALLDTADSAWVKRLGLTAAQSQVGTPSPTMESLASQLQSENELIKQALPGGARKVERTYA